jgi:hypothetical protein
MNTENVGNIFIIDPSNSTYGVPFAFSPNNTSNYYAITDNTSILIRLNSSKHAHAPALANPLKNLPTIIKSIESEQLNTTHYFANAFAKSFVDSVLPVPAGPAGAPPKFNFNAPINVI